MSNGKRKMSSWKRKVSRRMVKMNSRKRVMSRLKGR